MTLPLLHEKPQQLVLEDLSDIAAQRAAFDYAGVKPEEQPLALVYDREDDSARMQKLANLTLVCADIKKPIEPETVMYDGEATSVCIGALRELARSRRSYQQRNAARILAENGMSRTAFVSRVIATAKVVIPKPRKPDYDILTEHLPPVILNHAIDVLPPLTEAEKASTERTIARELAELKRLRDATALANAKAIKNPAERNLQTANQETGQIAIVLNRVERDLLLAV